MSSKTILNTHTPRDLTFNQPSRPKGLKVVSESKFCAEFENRSKG